MSIDYSRYEGAYLGKARYENIENCSFVWAVDDKESIIYKLADIRGWGHLSSSSGPEQAAKMQDALGCLYADAPKLLAHCKEQDARVKELEAENAALKQTSGELCPKCGWRMKFPDEMCHCELEAENTKLRELLKRCGLFVRRHTAAYCIGDDDACFSFEIPRCERSCPGRKLLDEINAALEGGNGK